MKHGFYYTGICKGVRSFNKLINKQTGETRTVFMLGLSTPVENGYENQDRIFEVELGKKALANGLQNQFGDFVNQTITIPVFPKHRIWKDNVYTTTYFGSDTILDVIKIDSESLKSA